MTSSTYHQLVPPLRFRCVANDVYVGAYPTLQNFRYLHRLRLKTIVSLIPEKPTTDLVEFCAHSPFLHFSKSSSSYDQHQQQPLNNVHFKVDQYKDAVQLSFSDMSHIIQLMLDKRTSPIYIHCLDGRHASSLVVMCLRKLQNWSQDCLTRESHRYVHEWSNEDTDYVKQWKGPVVVPEQQYLAKWCVLPSRTGDRKHPRSVKLLNYYSEISQSIATPPSIPPRFSPFSASPPANKSLDSVKLRASTFVDRLNPMHGLRQAEEIAFLKHVETVDISSDNLDDIQNSPPFGSSPKFTMFMRRSPSDYENLAKHAGKKQGSAAETGKTVQARLPRTKSDLLDSDTLSITDKKKGINLSDLPIFERAKVKKQMLWYYRSMDISALSLEFNEQEYVERYGMKQHRNEIISASSLELPLQTLEVLDKLYDTELELFDPTQIQPVE